MPVFLVETEDKDGPSSPSPTVGHCGGRNGVENIFVTPLLAWRTVLSPERQTEFSQH
jgi:hypothetical protein